MGEEWVVEEIGFALSDWPGLSIIKSDDGCKILERSLPLTLKRE